MSKLTVNVLPFHTPATRNCTNCNKVLYYGEHNPCDHCLAQFFCDIEDYATVMTENFTGH